MITIGKLAFDLKDIKHGHDDGAFDALSVTTVYDRVVNKRLAQYGYTGHTVKEAIAGRMSQAVEPHHDYTEYASPRLCLTVFDFHPTNTVWFFADGEWIDADRHTLYIFNPKLIHAVLPAERAYWNFISWVIDIPNKEGV